MWRLISIVLLLGAAGYVFIAGWIQLVLPHETYAVLFSKTGGFHPEVIPPGQFTWRWERVLPTNVTLYSFELTPHRTTASVSGSLPSADVIQTVLPTATDFGYDTSFELIFALRPEMLPELVDTRGLRPDDLEGWYQTQSQLIAEAATELTLGESDRSLLADPSGLADFLLGRLQRRFPELDIVRISPRRMRVPDLELYERSRAAFLDLVEAQEQVRREAVAGLAQAREQELLIDDASRAAADRLRRYGELLTEYPILLQLLQLEGVDAALPGLTPP
jgi:hypothetical protein